jgi:hypothetical protein
MTEEQKNHWKKIFAESKKKRRRMEPIKRNQLALWLGRLIIAYNSLESSLASSLMMELVELIGKDEPPEKAPMLYVVPSLQRAYDAGLGHIVMGTLPFKQKLDFLTALLLKKFEKNEELQKHVNKMTGLMYAADEFRNKMVHSVWEVSHSEVSRIKAKTKGRKGLMVDKEETDITHLRSACNAIDCLEILCQYVLRQPDKSFLKLDYENYEKIGKALRPTPIFKKYPNILSLQKSLLA